MSDIADVIRSLVFRVAELERRGRNRSRIGTVTEIDPQRGLARVELATGVNGAPFVSGWIPWQEQAAGAARTHFPPSVGQQVRVRSQSGDLTDAEIEASLPSSTNTRPSSKGNEYVIVEVGSARVVVSDGGGTLRMSVGASSITLTDGAIVIEGADITLKGAISVAGASLTHNGANVGSSHVHGGIEPGPANTSPPAN